MKRIPLLAIAAILLSAGAAAQTTPIKKGLPAFTVMLVRNEVFSVDDLNAGIARLEKNLLARLNPQIPDAERERIKVEYMAVGKPKLLDAQIGAMLFRQFCEREKVTVSDADVTKYIARLKAQLGSASASDAMLEQLLAASQGVVLDLKTYTRDRLLLRAYIQAKRQAEVAALKGPAPDEILAAYDEMKGELQVPETAVVSVVFVDYAKKGPEERKKAQETMRALAATVKDDSAAFDRLLLASYDPNAGYSVRSTYTVYNAGASGHDPAFIEAIFKLAPGEISGLLDNKEGLQIVRLKEISPAKQLKLHDSVPGSGDVSVQDLIVQQLRAKIQDDYAAGVYAEVLAKLRGEASVAIRRENLKGVIGDSELDGIAARYAKKK